jgi:hypothetical protein
MSYDEQDAPHEATTSTDTGQTADARVPSRLAARMRAPSARPTHPVVLLSGEELSGKTFSALLLSASPRVGPAWVIQIGESDADPYGAIPDTRFSILDHDGTWPDLMATIDDATEGARLALAGEDATAPLLIIDSMDKEWELLSTWAENRARAADKARLTLARDPNADVPVGATYWNAANRRHRQLMTKLRAFPGIVVLTSREKWVTRMDASGNPTREREYTLESQKQLGSRVNAWVRLSRENVAQLVGLRHPGGGINPLLDRAYPLPDFTLEKLVFDRMGYDPLAAEGRREYAPVPGAEADPSVEEAQPTDRPPLGSEATLARRPSAGFAVLWALIGDAASRSELREQVWPQLQRAARGQQVTRDEALKLRGYLDRRATEVPERAEPAADATGEAA